jgi:hypothetical protein
MTSSSSTWLADAGTIVAILGTFSGIVRWLFHNAIDPIAEKVANHDIQIDKSLELGNSTNIKVARIEGYLASGTSGRLEADQDRTTKLPDVPPTIETPLPNGQIVEKPLIEGDAV